MTFEIFEKVYREEDTEPLFLEERKSIAKAEQEFKEGTTKRLHLAGRIYGVET